MVSLGSLMLVCYYTNWAQYRPGQGRFTPENIDPNLCTHINYAFASITDGVLTQFEWNDAVNYAAVMGLKTKNPNLKVILSVGGWNFGSGGFSDMATNPISRANFISTSVTFLRQYGFDGLDIDWEYPGSRPGSRPTDKSIYTVFVTELKSALAPFGLLLTAAVGVGFETVDSGYEISKIINQLDFINLMAYDFHGSWETFTGHNAPLYPRLSESGNELQKTLNIDSVINYWVNNGATKSKLILGLASYGRTFTLADENQYGLGSLANGAGNNLPYTNTSGMASYYEVCSLLNSGWTRIYNEEQQVPYIYNGNQWIGYDDEQSLTQKANYIVANSLGGGMFWTLDLDDFSGSFCGKGKYPLINKVKNILQSNFTSTSSSFTSTSTNILTTKLVTNSTTTSASNKNSTKITSSANKCYKGDGFYALPGCSEYYQCIYSGSTNQMAFNLRCPTGLLFDVTSNACNWPYNFKCLA